MTVQAIRRGVRGPGSSTRRRSLVERLAEPGRIGWETGGGTIGRLRELGFDWEAARALVVVDRPRRHGDRDVGRAADRRAARSTTGGGRRSTAGEPTRSSRRSRPACGSTTPTEVIVRSCAEDVTVDGVRFPAGRAAVPLRLRHDALGRPVRRRSRGAPARPADPEGDPPPVVRRRAALLPRRADRPRAAPAPARDARPRAAAADRRRAAGDAACCSRPTAARRPGGA